jgi:hypothetical protein
VPAAAGQTQSVSLTVYQGTVLDFAHQEGFGTAGPDGNSFGVNFSSAGTYTIVVDPFGAAVGTTSVSIS